jgi:hypothetical protein
MLIMLMQRCFVFARPRNAAFGSILWIALNGAMSTTAAAEGIGTAWPNGWLETSMNAHASMPGYVKWY